MTKPAIPGTRPREISPPAHRGSDEQLQRAAANPSADLLHTLGPTPEDRIARERCEREARRLEALRLQTGAEQQPAAPPPSVQPSQDRLTRERWQRESRQRDALPNWPTQRPGSSLLAAGGIRASQQPAGTLRPAATPAAAWRPDHRPITPSTHSRASSTRSALVVGSALAPLL